MNGDVMNMQALPSITKCRFLLSDDLGIEVADRFVVEGANEKTRVRISKQLTHERCGERFRRGRLKEVREGLRMHRLHLCIERSNDLSIIQDCQSYIHIVSLRPVPTPNAPGEPRPMAGATQERRLLGVGSTAKSATSGKAGGLKKVEPLKADSSCEPLKAVRL